MWLVLTVMAALAALERVTPARRDPAQPLLNVWTAIVNRVIQLAVSPGIALAASHATGRLPLPSLHLASWPLLYGAAAYLVLMDLGEYLFHRAQHAVPWLWRMHALHHSDPCMNVLTAERHFWGDALVKGLTIWPVVAMLTQPSAAILGIYAAASLNHVFVHANLPVSYGRFSWLINSPAYHRIHHSREPQDHGANFSALLPIFDVLLGSYRRPRHAPATGLAAQPRNPLEILVWPAKAAR
jgi:sterol desaturase/sphingolipid hydroxylase (fatty acid hydroxylase superfamily)